MPTSVSTQALRPQVGLMTRHVAVLLASAGVGGAFGALVGMKYPGGLEAVGAIFGAVNGLLLTVVLTAMLPFRWQIPALVTSAAVSVLAVMILMPPYSPMADLFIANVVVVTGYLAGANVDRMMFSDARRGA